MTGTPKMKQTPGVNIDITAGKKIQILLGQTNLLVHGRIATSVTTAQTSSGGVTS